MKEMTPDRRNTLKRLMPSVMLVLFGGLLIFTPLISCKQDPMEAKKMKMAEIAKEAFDIMEKVEKNPDLRNDPNMQKRMQELEKEGEDLLNELTGGDKSKEEEIMEEVVKKYAPEYYKKMMATKGETQKRSMYAWLKSVKTALEIYYTTNAEYPKSLDDLMFPEDPSRRMIDSIPIDRFSKNKEQVKYSLYTTGSPTYVAWSVGPNGISDIQGAGDNVIIGEVGDDIFVTNARDSHYELK